MDEQKTNNVCTREKGERSELRTNFMLISGIILICQIVGGAILSAFHVQVTQLWAEMTYANEFWFFGLLLGGGASGNSFLGRIKSKFSGFGGQQ